MTTLQKIVTAAKKLKKQYPNRYSKWTDYIKAASKKIKKPGKKIADVNVTYRSKKEADYLVERKKNGRFKGTVRLAGVKKKPVAKKKPAAVKKHTDKGSHNTNIKVVSGVRNMYTVRDGIEKEINFQLSNIAIFKAKKKSKTITPAELRRLEYLPTYIRSLKTQLREQNKHITQSLK
jgi:hypothetical protein